MFDCYRRELEVACCAVAVPRSLSVCGDASKTSVGSSSLRLGGPRLTVVCTRSVFQYWYARLIVFVIELSYLSRIATYMIVSACTTYSMQSVRPKNSTPAPSLGSYAIAPQESHIRTLVDVYSMSYPIFQERCYGTSFYAGLERQLH